MLNLVDEQKIKSMLVKERHRYKTLTELSQYLRTEYANRNVSVKVKDIDDEGEGYANIPAFLFRGEPGLYEKSLTSMQRMKATETLSLTERNILEAISRYVDNEVQNHFRINQRYSAAYIQHYGLFSELLDFSSDLEVGIRFASEKKTIGKPGRIAVLDVLKAIQNGTIIDLTAHPFAHRPRRQRAYGVFCKNHIDMKDLACIDEIGITWFEFEQNDAPLHIYEMDIYNVSDDVFAGVLSLIVDDCIKAYGRIPYRTAELLASRIDRVPLFSVTDDINKIAPIKDSTKNQTAADLGIAGCTWRLASLSELGCKPDDQERINSIRKWAASVELPPPTPISYPIPKNIFAIQIQNLAMTKNWTFT